MIKKLPRSWASAYFTEVLDIQGGTQPPKSEFVFAPIEGYVRLLQIRDFGDRPVPTYVPFSGKLKTCQPDDILIARYGASIGRILTGMEGAYNVALAKVLIPEHFDKKYIYYMLKSEIFQEPILLNKRSAQDGFNKHDLSKIAIPIPPRSEQTKIAEAIENFLQKLKGIKAGLDKLPENLRLLKNQFINLAATGALTNDWRALNKDVLEGKEIIANLTTKIMRQYEEKLTGYQNKTNVKPRKLMRLDTVYDKNSSQKIPESWAWSKLGNIAEVVSGVTKGKLYNSEKLISIPYLGVANVQDGFLDLKETRTIKVPKSEVAKYQLVKGDILMTEGGDRDKLGRGTIWENEIKSCIHQNHIFRARVDDLFINPYYVTFYTKSAAATSYFYENANQTVNLASISLTALSNLPVPVPPIEEQNEIVKQLQKYMQQIDLCLKGYTNASSYIESFSKKIFSAAFSGNLVKEDPTHEPASELLEQIKAAKIALTFDIQLATNAINPNSTVMKRKPIKTFEELLVCLKKMGGQAAPNDLLSASLLENDIDLFFEFLRLGRDLNLLVVPIGKSGVIKINKNEA